MHPDHYNQVPSACRDTAVNVKFHINITFACPAAALVPYEVNDDGQIPLDVFVAEFTEK